MTYFKNRIAFNQNDLRRILFEHKLEEHKIEYLFNEVHTTYHMPGQMELVFWVQDKDWPKAVEIYQEICKEEEFTDQNAEVIIKITGLILLFLVLYFLVGYLM